MKYRGFDVKWRGSRDGGHWEIYKDSRWLGSADDGELDQVIDEVEEDD